MVSSFNQLYFNIRKERENVIVKGNSPEFNVFQYVFQKEHDPVDYGNEMEENSVKLIIDVGNTLIPTTVAWCSLDQLNKNNRFCCEVVMRDATGGTNSQKSPVVMMVSMDGKMKNTCLLTSISVDETSNSFMNILQAFQMIYGKDVCSRVKTSFSDGDEQITGSIDSYIYRGSFSSDTKRFLCSWHTVTLKLQKETSHFQEDGFAYRKIFKQFVYHAVHYCENYQEFSQVMKCTHDFIASTPLSDHKKEILCNFVTNIDEKSPFISYYNRQHARTLGTHTGGQNESENKELK